MNALETKDVSASVVLRHRPVYECYKRLFDICFALFGLFFISPVMIVTAIAIKFDSPGPVLYKGLRTGRHGKFFYIYG